MRERSEMFISGRFFHNYNHASQNNLLFHDKADYEKCLQLMNKYLTKNSTSSIAVCLMPNHYHLLLKQNSDVPIYLQLNKLWWSYSHYYNQKYQAKGSVFAGRMQHIYVDEENYLYQLVGYIHLNPVKAGIITDPEQWPWSNYAECLGKRNLIVTDMELLQNVIPFLANYAAMINKILDDNAITKYLVD